ncbi:hypothetical protein K1719_002894 [Acacia pycnantha]|nr:hypothetical protein K1719_002894 [Acacia pycnantha]
MQNHLFLGDGFVCSIQHLSRQQIGVSYFLCSEIISSIPDCPLHFPELLLRIRKEAEAGSLPSNVAAGMEELYQNYKKAVMKSGHPKADEIVLSNMTIVLDRIYLDVEDPFVFEPHHKAKRDPFDYSMFGQNYIRPLIDFRNSYLGNISLKNY